MKKFENGQEVWGVYGDLAVRTIKFMGDVVLLREEDDLFPTEAEAHAEAVRRAHSIVNRAELARARAMPYDATAVYCVFSESGEPVSIGWAQGSWSSLKCPVRYATCTDAICAVIPEPSVEVAEEVK